MRLDAPGVRYTHDAVGARTEKELRSAASTDYTWDEDNRLTLAEPPVGEAVAMTYNADGRRVRKTVGPEDTKFIYDYRRVLQEYGFNSQWNELFAAGIYDVAVTATYK